MDCIFNYFRTTIRRFLAVTLISMVVLLPSTTLAQTIKQQRMCCCRPILHPWFATGELGYGNVLDIDFNDGQTPIGRFSIGRDLVKMNILTFALEAGIQNGNVMRLPFAEGQFEDFGEFDPVVATPILDLLLTAKITPSHTVPLFALVKIGPAYRRFHFLVRNDVNDKAKMSIEAQAGLGYQLNNRTNIHLSYQRIFGSNPNFHVSEVSEEQPLGYINRLPAQYAVLFGISTSL